MIEHPRYGGGHLGATRLEEINDSRFNFEPVLAGIFNLLRELGIERCIHRMTDVHGNE